MMTAEDVIEAIRKLTGGETDSELRAEVRFTLGGVPIIMDMKVSGVKVTKYGQITLEVTD